MTVRISSIPYVSTFGRHWKDVVVVKFASSCQADAAQLVFGYSCWTEFLREYVSPRYIPPEQVEIIVRSKAMFFKSFCNPHTEKGVSRHQRKRRFKNLGGIEKCDGAHAPDSIWIRSMFPEFNAVEDYRQVRIGTDDSIQTALVSRHKLDCRLNCTQDCALRKSSEAEACQQLNVRYDDDGGDSPRVEPMFLLFLRIHIYPKNFACPSANLEPLPLSDSRHHTLSLKSICTCTRTSDRTLPCSFFAFISKPAGLPSEAHVSNALDCVQGRVNERIELFLPNCLKDHSLTYSSHPFNRLDTWVSGVLGVYIQRDREESGRKHCRRLVCSQIQKRYEALSVIPEKEDPNRTLRVNSVSDNSSIRLALYMPPSRDCKRSSSTHLPFRHHF